MRKPVNNPKAEVMRKEGLAILERAREIVAATDAIETHVTRAAGLTERTGQFIVKQTAFVAPIPKDFEGTLGLDAAAFRAMILENANLLEEMVETLVELSRDCMVLLLDLSSKEGKDGETGEAKR